MVLRFRGRRDRHWAICWRAIGNADSAVKAAEVGLLRNESDCDFAGRAHRTQGWYWNAINGRRTASIPLRKSRDSRRFEIAPTSDHSG
jgi:hypothetical protein